MRNSTTLRFMAVALVVIAGTLSLDARILSQKQRTCPDGSKETFTILEDDCSGDIYTIYVDCLGNTYFNVPDPQWRAIFASPDTDPFPERFWEMVRLADFSIPGAPTGIYLHNDAGEQVNFRNPHSVAEIAPYQNCSPHTSN